MNYKEREINYFTFVIGYEFLNTIKNNKFSECDSMYDFANYIATDFVNSDEFKNVKYSGYEMLYTFIYNKGGIDKLYNDYFNQDKENIHNLNGIEREIVEDKVWKLTDSLNDDELDYAIYLMNFWKNERIRQDKESEVK